jgi:hypothetical protein
VEIDMTAFCIATPVRMPAVTYASQQAALTTCGLAMCMSATETQTRFSSEPVVGRRAMLRLAAVAATYVVLHPTQRAQAANVNGRQLVNGVLSAYGLPTMTDVVGLVPLLEQYDRLVVSFDYPTDWLTQRNVLPATEDAMDIKASSAKLSFGSSLTPMEGRASGLTVGDYRKAEGLAFFVNDVGDGSKSIADVAAKKIMDLVTPGDATGTANLWNVTKDVINPVSGYRTILSKYESTTISGYTVERRGITSATLLGGKLYCLAGTCSENRIKKIGDKLLECVDSFRVYNL